MVNSHGTHTHEHGYRFHVGVGVGGPKNTCRLPVTSTTNTLLLFITIMITLIVMKYIMYPLGILKMLNISQIKATSSLVIEH